MAEQTPPELGNLIERFGVSEKEATRIELTDTPSDVVMKMSEGNPGAMTVCMNILDGGEKIDPDGALGGLGAILMLDTLGIYSSRIWMLYKDVCGENLSTMLAIERAWQFGFVDSVRLNHAIDNRGRGIDIEDLVRQVKDRLPAFGVDAS